MKCFKVALIGLGLLTGMVVQARAVLVSLSASGIITSNSSVDTTIPAGTPWMFEIIYDTVAVDRDFVLTGAPAPTFGRFTNEDTIPALTFFHYKAGNYEVILDAPSDFGPFSAILITFGGVDAIDINLNSEIFPPLSGRAVSFHADFNDFSGAILTSDGLPTDTSLSLQSFDESTVSLLPAGGGTVSGSTSGMTSFTIAVVPEPSNWVMAAIGLGVLAGRRRGRTNSGLGTTAK